MTTDILSPEVREAWEAMLDGSLGARVDFTGKYRKPVATAIEAALIRGAEAEKQLEVHKAGVINQGPRHPMQGLEGVEE